MFSLFWRNTIALYYDIFSLFWRNTIALHHDIFSLFWRNTIYPASYEEILYHYNIYLACSEEGAGICSTLLVVFSCILIVVISIPFLVISNKNFNCLLLQYVLQKKGLNSSLVMVYHCKFVIAFSFQVTLPVSLLFVVKVVQVLWIKSCFYELRSCYI